MYGVIGNEYRDVGRNLEAESSLKKQLLIAKQNQFPDEESNALGSLGRIYVKARKYSEGKYLV